MTSVVENTGGFLMAPLLWPSSFSFLPGLASVPLRSSQSCATMENGYWNRKSGI